MLVHQTDGTADFSWTSKSLNDMQHPADALTALSKPGRTTDRRPPVATGTSL